MVLLVVETQDSHIHIRVKVCSFFDVRVRSVSRIKDKVKVLKLELDEYLNTVWSPSKDNLSLI